MDGPKVSVVVPYYNNDRTFLRCLQSFANEQTVAPHEIVIVDDGSSRPAAPIVEAFESNVPVKLVQGDHGGQSRATNIGVRAAEGDVVLLSCADIVANPSFVEVHARAHAEARSRGESIGVLGHIAYPPWMKMTPFLRYLAGDGPQFCFGAIRNPDRVDGALVYSPNFSVERSWMRRLGGFDELLPYGFQDTDLGIRLVQAGIRLLYRKGSLAHHDHPNDVSAFVRRNRSIGHYMCRMCKRHPTLFRQDKTRLFISLVAAYPQMLSDLLKTTLRFESAFLRSPRRDPAHESKLRGLYEQTVTAAFFEGALEGDDGLGDALGFSVEAWRRVRSRAPAAPMDTRQAAAS